MRYFIVPFRHCFHYDCVEASRLLQTRFLLGHGSTRAFVEVLFPLHVLRLVALGVVNEVKLDELPLFETGTLAGFFADLFVVDEDLLVLRERNGEEEAVALGVVKPLDPGA